LKYLLSLLSLSLSLSSEGGGQILFRRERDVFPGDETRATARRGDDRKDRAMGKVRVSSYVYTCIPAKRARICMMQCRGRGEKRERKRKMEKGWGGWNAVS
jgi:hypothetical protein